MQTPFRIVKQELYSLTGFVDVSPYTFADSNNDIGGNSAATGNTVINFGGIGTSISEGIQTLAQYSLNVGYNLVNNNNGAGINTLYRTGCISVGRAEEASVSVNHNTVTLHADGAYAMNTIENLSGNNGTANTISITDNLITDCTHQTTISANFCGIYNFSSIANLIISNNTLRNNSTNASFGNFQSIYTGNICQLININNNFIEIGTFGSTHPVMLVTAITNDFGSSTTTLSINSNTMQSGSFAAPNNGNTGLIYNENDLAITNINNNVFNNIQINSDADVFLIYNDNATPVTKANNDAVTNFNLSGNGSLYGYYNTGAPVSGVASIIGNNFSNLPLTGSGAFYGVQHLTSVNQDLIMANNTFSTIRANGEIHALYHSYGGAGSAITGNSITGLYSQSAIYGIEIGSSAASTSLTVSSNALGAFSTSANSGTVIGIYHRNGTNTSVYKNKIYDSFCIRKQCLH